MDKLEITGAAACTPEGVESDATVVVSDGSIESIGRPSARGDEAQQIEATGLYALPAFADMHAHGMDLFEFTGGWFDPATGEFDSSPAGWERGLSHYARHLAATGVANVFVATWAAPIEHLQRLFRHLRKYMAADKNGVEGARFCGGNLEGSFINPQNCGAQNPDLILDPSVEAFDAINESGVVRLVNVVPDFGERSLRLIDHVVGRGIIPGAGHTSATGDQVDEAVRHGLRYIVHFLNGPIGSSHKPFHGGGAVEAALRNDELYTELICDTYHVAPPYMRDVIARKTAQRVIAVSDQMFATRTRAVQHFRISGVEGEVAPGGEYVFVRGKPGTLFSSTLTMDTAFGNLLSLLTREMPGAWYRSHAALSFEDALRDVSRLCTGNLHDLLGQSDGHGVLKPGAPADLVLLDISGQPGDYQVAVKNTIIGGKVVFEADGAG